MSVPRIFYNPPKTQPDNQQGFFQGASTKIAQEMDETEAGVHVIPMKGFRASCVDLAWLMGRIEEFWEAFEMNLEDLAPLIGPALSQAVQTVKSFSAKVGTSGETLQINFTTKDDHGWYDYGIELSLPKKPDLKIVGLGIGISE